MANVSMLMQHFYVFKHNQNKFEDLAPELNSWLRSKRERAYFAYDACYRAYEKFGDRDIVHIQCNHAVWQRFSENKRMQVKQIDLLIERTQNVYRIYVLHILVLLTSAYEINEVMQECLKRGYRTRAEGRSESPMEELFVKACGMRKGVIAKKLVKLNCIEFPRVIGPLFSEMVNQKGDICGHINWLLANLSTVIQPPVFLQFSLERYTHYTAQLTSLRPFFGAVDSFYRAEQAREYMVLVDLIIETTNITQDVAIIVSSYLKVKCSEFQVSETTSSEQVKSAVVKEERRQDPFVPTDTFPVHLTLPKPQPFPKLFMIRLSNFLLG